GGPATGVRGTTSALPGPGTVGLVDLHGLDVAVVHPHRHPDDGEGTEDQHEQQMGADPDVDQVAQQAEQQRGTADLEGARQRVTETVVELLGLVWLHLSPWSRAPSHRL